jgi:hypothetical protein
MHTSSYKASNALEADAEALACGPESSFCKASLKSSWQDTFRADPCALETYAADNDAQYSYNMWQPSYASDLSRGNAFLNASTDANRFAPKQVTQESFLQGRGQVTSNPGCKGGFIRYLPEKVFEGTAETDKKPWDMSLFAQPTLVPRSCSSVTELDLIDRMKPRAHAFQERYMPVAAQLKERKIPEGVTLSSKKYPNFKELAQKGRYQ